MDSLGNDSSDDEKKVMKSSWKRMKNTHLTVSTHISFTVQYENLTINAYFYDRRMVFVKVHSLEKICNINEVSMADTHRLFKNLSKLATTVELRGNSIATILQRHRNISIIIYLFEPGFNYSY